MAEWSTYSLEDFILFSARVYFRLFEVQNAAFWPLHIALLAFGGALTWVALRRPGIGIVAGFVGLALCWALLGSTFLPRYAAINWAAEYLVPLVWLEVAALAAAAILAMSFNRGFAGWTGPAVVAYAAFGHPLTALVSGRSLQAAEVIGLAPDPTAIATLGFCLAIGGRIAAVACVVPALWCLASAATLYGLGVSAWWIPVACLVVTAVASTKAMLAR